MSRARTPGATRNRRMNPRERRGGEGRAGGAFRTQSTPVLPKPPEPLSVDDTLDASSSRGAT